MPSARGDGDSRVGVGEIPRHHDEVRTINRNWIATLDYAFSQRLGVSVSLPVVDRSHDHIHNQGGGQLPENWNFTEAGDARALRRYQYVNGVQLTADWSLLAGLATRF
jgi:hypothetical protein